MIPLFFSGLTDEPRDFETRGLDEARGPRERIAQTGEVGWPRCEESTRPRAPTRTMSSSLPLILCCMATSCLPVSRAQHESLLPEVDPIKDGLLIKKSALPAFADPSLKDGSSSEVVYRNRLVMYDFRPAYPPYKTETLNDLMLMPEKSNTVDDEISDDDEPSAFEQEHRDPDDQSSGQTITNESVNESTSENFGLEVDQVETNAPEGSDDDSSPQHSDEKAETPPAEEEESQVDSTSNGNGVEIVEESTSLESEADEEIITSPVEGSQDPTNGTGIEHAGNATTAELDTPDSADSTEADPSSVEHEISGDDVPTEVLSSSESIVEAGVDVSNEAELEDSTVGDTDLESGVVPNEKANVPAGVVESSAGDDTVAKETQDQAEPVQEIRDDPARLADETALDHETALDGPETASQVTVEAATLDEKNNIDSESGLTVGDEIIETPVDAANEMSLEDEKSALDQGLADDIDAAELSEKKTASNDEVLSPSTMTASSNNNPDANRQFVTGLDEIDKLFESVEAPDELDVGADGSSMQDVIVGQGIKIAWKRARNFGSEVRKRFEKVADSVQKALPQLGMLGGDDDDESEETLESLLSKMDISRDGGQTAIHEPAKRPERPKPVKAEKESKQFPLVKSPKAKKIWKFAQRKWHQARHLLDDILNLFADDDDEEEDEDIANLLKYGALGGAGANFGSKVDESFLNEQRRQKQ